MTVLSLLLHMRPSHRPHVRARTLFALLVVLWVMLYGVVTTYGADARDWTGFSRAEVEAEFGKPVSAMKRGDTDVLVYSNGLRFEIRDDTVVAFKDSNAAVMVKSDGTRYTPSEAGKARREDAVPPVAVTPAEMSAAPEPPSHVLGAAPPTAQEVGDDIDSTHADALDDPDEVNESGDGIDADDLPNPYAEAENFLENGGMLPEPEPVPTWATVTQAVVGTILHFVFAAVILQIALKWVGVPFFWADLAKVSAIYVLVREGLFAAGGLGGNWEFIRLFKVADIVSFIVLPILLFQFKIVLTGITALKVAAATKIATYVLMMILALALVFGLQALS